MTIGLRPFSPREAFLPPDAALEILRFFFPNDVAGICPGDLSFEDRVFAQALLVAAIDETRALGTLEGPDEVPLVAAGYIRIRPIVARMVAASPAAWFRFAVPENADGARIVEAARATVSIRHRAGWIAHVQGCPLL